MTGVGQYLLEVAHCPSQHRQNTIKQTALLSLLSVLPYTQCLVFSNYTSIAQATADFLNSRGFPAVYMSAVQDQARRMAVMETFRQFNTRILCSTDLTARGIDAENVNLVINMEVPWDHNTYLHRIGRGGRFGSHSVAVTLASRGQELDRMRGIVAMTRAEVRLMDGENIPGNLGKERENMKILGTEVEHDEGVKQEGEDVNNQEQTVPSKSKPSRFRSKKKQVNKPINKDEEDKLILKNFIDTMKTEPSQNKITYETAMEIAEKIARNESFNKIDIPKPQRPSEDMLESVGRAVHGLAKSREKEFDERLENVKLKTKDMNIDERIELLRKGGYSTIVKEDAELSPKPEIEIIATAPKSQLPQAPVVDDVSDSSISHSISDSESDSDSESLSETDSDSDDQIPPHPRLSIPSAPSAAWYQQWYQGVYQQRQALQMQEYYRYLQHMGYYQ